MTAASAVVLPALGKAAGLRMRSGASKTQLTLMGLFFIPSELAAARQIINEFNAQSKTIHVQYVQSSWGAIGSKMTAAFSSGDVPDLFQYYDAGLVPWAANGLLADLKKLMPASTWTEVVPGTLSVLTTASGGVSGLPFETETPLIYYRTDLLAKAGITPATPTTRWTWDQLRSYAQKLNNPKNGVFGINANWSSSELLFKNGLAWEAGANPIKHSGGNYSIDVNDPGTKTAIEYVRSLFANGTADPTSFDIDNVAYFAAGHCAMLIRGAWARSSIPSDKGGSTLKWAAMPFVRGAKANLGTGAAQTLSIPSIAKNREAAAEFLTWWGKPANVAKICEASGQVPPEQGRGGVPQILGRRHGLLELCSIREPGPAGPTVLPGVVAHARDGMGPGHVRLLQRQVDLCAVRFKSELRRYSSGPARSWVIVSWRGLPPPPSRLRTSWRDRGPAGAGRGRAARPYCSCSSRCLSSRSYSAVIRSPAGSGSVSPTNVWEASSGSSRPTWSAWPTLKAY